MNTTLTITFKTGEAVAYPAGEWDDYSYDGTAVRVKRGDVWVGVYNFDMIAFVELSA